MKRIVFPATNRVHLARQKLLLNELRKHFVVDIFQPKEAKSSMAASSILYAVEFNNFLSQNEYDYVLARGDRFELLPLVMVAVYKGLKVIHIEGGDLSGVIDNKVRHAITHLSDYHFCTNEESHRRLINMGVPLDRVWNFGSLDVEFAAKVKPRRAIRIKQNEPGKIVVWDDGKHKDLKGRPYIFVAYHPIDGENEKELEKALQSFKKYDIIRVTSNSDYGREYGHESFTPEDYINLMRYASVCVGNSSSLLKEASILSVGVVNVGDRQNNRLKPKNVLDVPCEAKIIQEAIDFQLKRKFNKDLTYYQEHTSKQITKKLKEIL